MSEDYDLVIHRALLMVAAAANQPPDRKERALRNAKSMIDKAAQRRYTGDVITNQAQAPPGEPPLLQSSSVAVGQPNRAASSRPPRSRATGIKLNKRGQTNRSR